MNLCFLFVILSIVRNINVCVLCLWGRGVFHLYNNHFFISDLHVRLPGLARRNYFYPSSCRDFFSLRGRCNWVWGKGAREAGKMRVECPHIFFPPPSPPPPPPPLLRLCRPRRLRFRSDNTSRDSTTVLGAKSDDCNHSHAVKGRE